MWMHVCACSKCTTQQGFNLIHVRCTCTCTLYCRCTYMCMRYVICKCTYYCIQSRKRTWHINVANAPLAKDKRYTQCDFNCFTPAVRTLYCRTRQVGQLRLDRHRGKATVTDWYWTQELQVWPKAVGTGTEVQLHAQQGYGTVEHGSVGASEIWQRRIK